MEATRYRCIPSVGFFTSRGTIMTISIAQRCVGLTAICALLLALAPAASAADQPVYAEGLAAGWQDWSWDASVDMSSGAQAHGGVIAAAATITAAWGGLRLHATAAVPAAGVSAVRFWVHG